jgi:hypothetical protein
MQTIPAGQAQDGQIRLNLSAPSLSLSELESQEIEISVVNSDGIEHAYERVSAGEVEIPVGEIAANQPVKVLIRDNSGTELNVESISHSDLPVLPEAEIVRKHGDIVLKAFVVLARTCRENSPDGNSTITTQADVGKYFVQPFVFVAKISEGEVVSLVETAKISIQSGDLNHSLSRLGQMDYAAFRELSGMSQSEHIAWTRNFYNHYFSAPGELYTIAQFRKQAPCADAPQVELGSDLKADKLELVIEDETQSPALAERILIRPTFQPAFSTYLKADQKLNDWTQCTIDTKTALPKTYNGDASECLIFSMSKAPFVKLDYLLPSQADLSLPQDVDPTRLLFYGHSKSRNMAEMIVEHSAELVAAVRPELELEDCMYTGGLTSVPLNGESYSMPLKEMNATVGSVINTARRSGSYTALPEFYQGDVNMMGEILMPVCIPGASSCDDYKVVKFKQKQCLIKADSGVAAASISDSFVYPDYFEISGVVAE